MAYMLTLMLIQFVNSSDMGISSIATSLAIQFAVGAVAGYTLKDMHLPKGTLVMIVKRGTKHLIPYGSMHLHIGDKLLLISESVSTPEE